MSKIEKVIKCAYSAFSPRFGQSNFQEKVTRLENLMDKILPNDVKLQESLEIIEKNRSKKPTESAPVAYIHLIETPVFSAGIFVIQKDCKIPLHDHPGMNGLLKVLHGKLSILSFDTDVPTSVNLPAYKVTNKKVTELDAANGCLLLTPEENNVHEITAIGGPASFLDILAPPYDYKSRYGEERICNYYELQEISRLGRSHLPYHEIRKTFCPSDFWCDECPYLGPSVSHLLEEF